MIEGKRTRRERREREKNGWGRRWVEFGFYRHMYFSILRRKKCMVVEYRVVHQTLREVL